jgi:hypothetical protein
MLTEGRYGNDINRISHYEIVFAAHCILESLELAGGKFSRYSYKTNAWELPSYYFSLMSE